MEFECIKCRELFRPHPFIGMRHPSNAKCPKCGAKGKLTKKGRKARKSRFGAMNQRRRKS